MINRITLVGRLGSDPEIRTLESGVMVARLGIATSENYKDKTGNWQEQTEWHDIVLWRHLAERAQEYLKKGDMIYLEGKLSHRKWQDKDGNSRKTTEVVGNYFRKLSSSNRDNSDSNYNRNLENTDPASSHTPSEAANSSESNKNDSLDDDVLPF